MKKLLLIMAVLLALTLTLCACQNKGDEGAQDENKTEFTAKELFGLDLTEIKAMTLKLKGADVTNAADMEKVAKLVSGVTFKKIDSVEIEDGVPVQFVIGDTVNIAFPVSKDKTQGEVICYGTQWYQISEGILDELVKIADTYNK